MKTNLFDVMHAKLNSINNDALHCVYQTSLPYSEKISCIRFTYTSPIAIKEITTEGCTFESYNENTQLTNEIVGAVTFSTEPCLKRTITLWGNKREYLENMVGEEILRIKAQIEKFIN